LEKVIVRFDSLGTGPGCRSFGFSGFQEEIVAVSPAEVAPAIERVEAAVAGGRHAAGFISYEAAPGFDAALAVHAESGNLPLLWFGIFDRRTQTPALDGLPEGQSSYELGPLTASLDRSSYEAGVREILDLIAAGDTYQVNFTFRLRGAFAGDEFALYRDLCRAQRSTYCAYLRTAHGTLISASPELFFRRRGSAIELRPMKGTRPRGRWSDEDREIARSLACSSKDRAENLMIVDLLRNDVGRVAEFGSVSVPALFEVESYPTVHQLTSTITARLRKETSLLDLLRALFPSGSVTGAPKIRTSQIIKQMEDSPRGPYTGAIGFVSPEETVFSVAIRTLRLEREVGAVEVGIGSGITADSDPSEEYEECIGKGAFLRRPMPTFQLVESLRLEPSGDYPLLELHLRRLADSAAYFGFMGDLADARQALWTLARTLPGGLYKVRLLLGRDGAIVTRAEPIPPVLPTARLRLAKAPVDETDIFLYHKTTHRPAGAGTNAIASDCDDVIFWNRRGELTETARANLVLDLDGAMVTPPIECGLLPGTMRRRLLDEGVLSTRVLTFEDLGRARRVLLINAVRGWREGILLGPHGPPPTA
jgi:para-aminobenzoate synthetase / 4-amino-4-deoxychorismate lyase